MATKTTNAQKLHDDKMDAIKGAALLAAIVIPLVTVLVLIIG